jgi:DNA-binding NtrC family response regulator
LSNLFVGEGKLHLAGVSGFRVLIEPADQQSSQLAIIAIFIPPLRDRKEDIMPLVDFFIDRYNRKFKKSIRCITDETRRLILSHNWPGNVRELKNTIERGMILEDEPLLRPL